MNDQSVTQEIPAVEANVSDYQPRHDFDSRTPVDLRANRGLTSFAARQTARTKLRQQLITKRGES